IARSANSRVSGARNLPPRQSASTSRSRLCDWASESGEAEASTWLSSFLAASSASRYFPASFKLRMAATDDTAPLLGCRRDPPLLEALRENQVLPADHKAREPGYQGPEAQVS